MRKVKESDGNFFGGEGFATNEYELIRLRDNGE